MKICIATAFYEIKAYSPYVHSLINTIAGLTEAKIECMPLQVTGDSYVDHAKNLLLYEFLQSDCTDIVMIDSDLSWDAKGFAYLISAPVDFVGGVFPSKNNWEHYPCTVICDADGYAMGDSKTGLIRAQLLPGGFLRLTRRCIEKMYKAYEMLNYVQGEKKICGLFKTDIIDGVFYGEDYLFCKKWLALGEKIWLEPRITFQHFGVKGYEGNYHEYRIKLAQEKKDVKPVDNNK